MCKNWKKYLQGKNYRLINYSNIIVKLPTQIARFPKREEKLLNKL